MLFSTYYAQNYAGIIWQGLVSTLGKLEPQSLEYQDEIGTVA